MTSKGGSAFPLDGADGRGRVEGMTLLDYFAGQALEGYRSRCRLKAGYPGAREMFTVEETAKSSYDDAAAMIAEKRKREKA